MPESIQKEISERTHDIERQIEKLWEDIAEKDYFMYITENQRPAVYSSETHIEKQKFVVNDSYKDLIKETIEKMLKLCLDITNDISQQKIYRKSERYVKRLIDLQKAMERWKKLNSNLLKDTCECITENKWEVWNAAGTIHVYGGPNYLAEGLKILPGGRKVLKKSAREQCLFIYNYKSKLKVTAMDQWKRFISKITQLLIDREKQNTAHRNRIFDQISAYCHEITAVIQQIINQHQS